MDIIRIDRASEETVQRLIDMGILYIGEDNQLHVKEEK